MIAEFQDLIDRWRSQSQWQRDHGEHNVAGIIEQVVNDFEARLLFLAEGLAEPTRDGLWWIAGEIAEPLEIVYVRQRKEWWVCKDGEWRRLHGRRVWPLIDPRKGGGE